MADRKKRRRFYTQTLGPLLGLVAGFGLGFLAHGETSPVWQGLLAVAEPVGTLWVNALRMIVVPFMLVLLIVAIASVRQGKTFGQLGVGALGVHIGLMVLGAGFAVGLFQLFVPGITPASELGNADLPPNDASSTDATDGSFGDWIAQLIPTNLFQAAANDAIIPLIIVAILFGFALRSIPAERRELLVNVFRGLQDTFEVILHWLVMVMTLGVFAISFTVGVQTGTTVLKNFATFLVGISLILLLFTGVLYLVMVYVGQGRFSEVARALWPAQMLAASTRSSLICLPLLAEGGRKHLGVPDQVSGFVLPLSNSTFRLNRAISSPLNYIFLAHFYGLPADAATVAIFVIYAVLSNFSSPGLPSMGLFRSAPLYLAAGIPLEGVVMLKAIDSIPDIFKTICNVTGDMTVLFLTSQWAQRRGLVPAAEPVVANGSMASRDAVTP